MIVNHPILLGMPMELESFVYSPSFPSDYHRKLENKSTDGINTGVRLLCYTPATANGASRGPSRASKRGKDTLGHNLT